MLKGAGVNLANLGASYANGTTFNVEWVPIETPDSLRIRVGNLDAGAPLLARLGELDEEVAAPGAHRRGRPNAADQPVR